MAVEQGVDLVSRLEVVPVAEHEFESSLESFDGRSFGGEILAKAVMAGLRSCPGRTLHSVHAYFLRPVPPEQTVRFTAHVLRDGRRFSSRRVTVGLGGRRVAEVSISLAAEASGPGFAGPEARIDDRRRDKDQHEGTKVTRSSRRRLFEGEPSCFRGVDRG